MSPTERKPSTPALQNVPIRTEVGRQIRDTFTKGRTFVETDYSALEMRIAATLTGFPPEGHPDHCDLCRKRAGL